MEKYTNASAATWARTICLIVALLNSLLASFNKSPLPIDNEQLQQVVSTLITVFRIGNLPNCCEVFSVLHRYRRKLFIVPLLYQMPGHISIDKSLKSDNSKKKSP